MSKPEIQLPELLKYAETAKFQTLDDLKRGLDILQNEKILFITKDSKGIKFSDPLLRPFLALRFKELRNKHAAEQLTLFEQ